ncbi:recombinase family protein [Microbacterium sp.]|uniref:recombinase family protein n=1 Tax=Microbacterium sp. TaxID=51671 RepID=UPI0027330E84|nr:recombinase family protein [Microbacterium sp.]MDP3953190.1 recombinase family protein [Microbacterium sp.]
MGQAETSESAGAAAVRDAPRTGSGETPRRNGDASTPVSAGSGTLVGYARVSTADQVIDRQLDALAEAGCSKIFTDHGVSGTRATRPGLADALGYLRPGDTLVVQSLDRLGRRTADLLQLVESLEGRGVAFRILNLGLDTATPSGRLVLVVMAALAEMEREVLAERVRDGLAAARARGRRGGRPASLTAEQVEHLCVLAEGGHSAAAIARILGTSDRTVRRHLERARA